MTEPQPQCLDLDAEQSARLTEAAGDEPGTVFAVCARATHPHDPQRWRLWLVPSTAKRVNEAVKRLTPPTPSTTATATAKNPEP